MLATREIKRKIKSVKNIQKMAKAMELISAIKMRKAIEAVLNSRPYAQAAWEILKEIALRIKDFEDLLLFKKEKKDKALALVISSNRGLCGAYNSKVIEKALELKKEFKEVEYVTLGKKGAQLLALKKAKVIADFPKEDLTREIKSIITVANFLFKTFLEDKADQVFLIYTDFYSALKQLPRAKRILPVSTEKDRELGTIEREKELIRESFKLLPYTIEPSPEAILPSAVKRLLEVQIFQAILEAEASEHSARMLAMKQAKDSAQELIGTLTLEYNKARQASITKEISEIVAGKFKTN